MSVPCTRYSLCYCKVSENVASSPDATITVHALFWKWRWVVMSFLCWATPFHWKRNPPNGDELINFLLNSALDVFESVRKCDLFTLSGEISLRQAVTHWRKTMTSEEMSSLVVRELAFISPYQLITNLYTFCNIHRRTTGFDIHLTKDILLIAGRCPNLWKYIKH